MMLTPLQEQVLAAIRAGTSARPITARQLATATKGYREEAGKEGANMRAIINALRTKGYPICASGKGYWWPQSVQELDTYIDSLTGRIEDIRRAKDGLIRARAHMLTGAGFISPQEVATAGSEVEQPSQEAMFSVRDLSRKPNPYEHP